MAVKVQLIGEQIAAGEWRPDGTVVEVSAEEAHDLMRSGRGQMLIVATDEPGLWKEDASA